MKADQKTLYRHVEFMTTLRPFRNYQNHESLQDCLFYISGELYSYGYGVTHQMWEVEGRTYINVIAHYLPEKPRKLIVGAHYDVAGDQPGADDNASAVAGLLETARMVALSQPDLDYGIEFVAFCLEEPPFFGTEEMGSYVHAKSLNENDTEVIGMICYEMIGYFSDEPGSQEYPHPALARFFPDRANFITVVGRQRDEAFNNKVHELMRKGSGINVEVISMPDVIQLSGLSDHSSYWKFGYPACMINDTSFMRNPHYHKMSDDIDTLDFVKMTEVVNSTFRAVVGMDKKVPTKGPLKNRILKGLFDFIFLMYRGGH